MDFEDFDEGLQALLECAASVLVELPAPEPEGSEEDGIHIKRGKEPLEQKAL